MAQRLLWNSAARRPPAIPVPWSDWRASPGSLSSRPCSGATSRSIYPSLGLQAANSFSKIQCSRFNFPSPDVNHPILGRQVLLTPPCHMPPPKKRRFWRVCRIYFRRLRLVVWLVILLLVGVLSYLNQVGLPDFVKKPLLEKLRARGLDLRFSRLRLRWYNGFVAENVRFARTDEPLSPR